MAIKVNATYKVEDAIVVMERIKNTEVGAPRWKATVVTANGAYTFNVIGYDGEKDEAREAYRLYTRYRGM